MLASVFVVAAVAAPQADASAVRQSKTPIPESSAWRQDVIDPGEVVYPKAVFLVNGTAANVQNTQGLKEPGGAAATIVSTGLTSKEVGMPTLLLDLGANVGGYVEIGIRSSSGTPIRLGYSETLKYMLPHGDTRLDDVLGMGFSYGVSDDPDGRTDVFQTTGPAQFRSPGIRGAQRYIAVQLDGPGTASIDYVRVRTEHLHPGAGGYAGYFLSSDQTLNRVWYAAAYTFAMDSFRDLRPGALSRTVVTDGAKRDRSIWAGDLGLEDLAGNYSLRSAPGVLRASLQAFSCLQYDDGQLSPTTQIAVQCPNDPPPPVASASQFPAGAQPAPDLGALRLPQYTAAWVIALRDYYMFTGNRRFAHLMMPVVRRGLAYFLANLDGGLYRTPSQKLTYNWHPLDTAGGIDAYTNASLFRALLAGAMLERRVGMGRRAANAYLSQAGALRSAMLARLWRPQLGAFIGNTDDPHANHTQDAQVEAVLGGITAPNQSLDALHFIDARLMTPFGVANGEFDDDPYMGRYISPFISSTELLARLSVGDTNSALNLIRRTWGQMLVAGPGTIWESMQLNGLPGSGTISLAHGWGGGPVPALSGYVLGIRPTTPGYRHWIVAPQPGDLHYAQGQAPTPHGPLASRWRRWGHLFKLTVAAPRGTSGVVKLPLPRHARKIAMDGKKIRAKRRRGVLTFKKVRGRHTFVAG